MVGMAERVLSALGTSRVRAADLWYRCCVVCAGIVEEWTFFVQPGALALGCVACGPVPDDTDLPSLSETDAAVVEAQAP